MAQIRVTPNNRINVAETKDDLKLMITINICDRAFMRVTQIVQVESWDAESKRINIENIEKEILINIDHIISIC